MKFKPCPGCKTPAKCAKDGCQKQKNKMSKGGMTRKAYKDGGFCTGPAKGYKK